MLNGKHNINFSDSENEIQAQTEWLERQITHELCELRIITGEHELIETNINDFLKEYYSEVGDLFKTTAKMDKEINAFNLGYSTKNNMQFKEIDLEGDLYVADDSKDRDTVIEEEAKRLYRKLAKVCHPDMLNSDPDASSAFSMLNDSYRKNDLSLLISIEQSFLGDQNDFEESVVETLERLERKHDSIKNNCDRIKIKVHKLKNSKSYKLMQRVKWSKMCGDNLIEKIKENMENEIRRKEIILARYKFGMAKFAAKKEERCYVG